jgi:flagellar motor switch protein FliN/FliY
MNTDVSPDSEPLIERVELTPLSPVAGSAAAAGPLTLAALASVKTTVTLVVGRAHTTVGDILSMKEGAVLALDTELNAPFDIVLNDNVIARGELVAVGDHFGVCVTQVAPAS